MALVVLYGETFSFSIIIHPTLKLFAFLGKDWAQILINQYQYIVEVIHSNR